MIPAWIQPELSETQRAVREHFTEGGSLVEVMLLLVGLIALLVLLWSIRRRQEVKHAAATIDDPQRLFGDLLERLELSGAQRRFLLDLAADLQLEHPTTILLSRRAFERHVDHRRAQERRQDAGQTEALVSRLRARLFPTQ